MKGKEMYVLGSRVDVGVRCITPVIRVSMIISPQLGFVTISPAAILIMDGKEKFRIALEDHLSWGEISETIPGINGYRDLVFENNDEDSGDPDLPD